MTDAPVPGQHHGQPYVPPQQTPNGPIMAATAPAVAGLKTVPDLRMRRLIGVSVWALALACSGFVLGAIAMIRLMGELPGWFEPVFAATGVVGLGLIIAAFVTVRYRMVPWLLLGTSTVILVAGVIMLGSV